MCPERRADPDDVSRTSWLERRFGIRSAGSNLQRECFGGLTTFLTMSYILVVNPIVFLQAAGMPVEGAILATALASAVATLIMGLYVNLPIALAPGMGMNALFAFGICPVFGWKAGLGVLFLVACIFLLLTVGKVRERITAAVPRTLRFAAAAGIGLFICLIGLEHAGVVVDHPETLVTLGDLRAPHVLLALFGLGVTLVLMSRRIRTAMFWGMAAAAAGGVTFGLIALPEAWMEWPTGALPGLEMDLAGAVAPERLGELASLGLALLFFVLFDAMGTLYAVGAEAGLLDEQGDFPRLGRALTVDAGSSMLGALMGTSSVTCFIESATGVSVGARTGLANIVTGVCFLAAIPLMPAVLTLGAGVAVGDSVFYPVTASALIVVGVLMARNVVRIDWDDLTEALPAFFTMVVMPFTFSISHGLAAGFVSYAAIKLLAGKGRSVDPIVYVVAAIFALRYALIPVH